MENLERNLSCEEIKLNLIQEICNKSCETILRERDLKDNFFKFYEKRINYAKMSFLSKSSISKHPKNMYDIYKMLYDSDPQNPSALTKVFCIKASELNYKNGLIIHLAFFEGKFELIFEDELEKKYYTILDISNLKEINDNDFRQCIANYEVNLGTYTDRILETISFGKYKNNTRIINIPFNGNFDFEPITPNTYIEFYPAVSANYNLRFSLMIRLIDMDNSSQIPSDSNFQDIYYDDFCLKPPGC
ncbi:hypothetical protein [Chryseobacterium gambrini]|uniref:hypothetical protein n=1 Tax=Chryseobacterium gambrini TaxID=373672 RepID=UPI0022F1C78D|nr:hypothetical protein [Chryseobacterium gambrini]WBV51680.1 hypothetical protein PFY09_15240 [Chryseobacterium gambrini]